MERTLKEWFDMLKEPYISKAMNNTVFENNLEYLNSVTVYSLDKAIKSGFIWSGSPEGHEYWLNINRNVKYYVQDEFKHLV